MDDDVKWTSPAIKDGDSKIGEVVPERRLIQTVDSRADECIDLIN